MRRWRRGTTISQSVLRHRQWSVAGVQPSRPPLPRQPVWRSVRAAGWTELGDDPVVSFGEVMLLPSRVRRCERVVPLPDDERPDEESEPSDAHRRAGSSAECPAFRGPGAKSCGWCRLHSILSLLTDYAWGCVPLQTSRPRRAGAPGNPDRRPEGSRNGLELRIRVDDSSRALAKSGSARFNIFDGEATGHHRMPHSSPSVVPKQRVGSGVVGLKKRSRGTGEVSECEGLVLSRLPRRGCPRFGRATVTAPRTRRATSS